QRPDGTFACGEELAIDSVLTATATALAGLLTWRRQCNDSGVKIDAACAAAIARSLAVLSRLHSRGENIDQHAVGWAIAAWQLGQFEDFRQALPHEPLLKAIEQSIDEPLLEDLTRYARAAAA